MEPNIGYQSQVQSRKLFPKLSIFIIILLLLGSNSKDKNVNSIGLGNLPTWEVQNPISTIFVMDSIPSTSGSLAAGDSTVPSEWLDDPAIDTLLLMMQARDIFFYKTSTHPSGIVNSNDIVIIKGNFQWTGRNTTNTDRIKGLIWQILNHPDGFTGEIIVCDNTQKVGINESDNNSEDTLQSIIDVVNTFSSKGYPVSILDWSYVWDVVVEEFSLGNYNDGFVYEPDSKISYPKFTSPSGNYKISLKYGIWDSNSQTYDSDRLCIINFPVLKAHSWSGATIALKNWIGVLTTAYADERFGGALAMHDDYFFGPYALVAKVMAVTFPKLTIVDATWTSTLSNSTLEDIVETRILLGSTDPCAVSWYSAKFILTPIAINPYNTNPDLPGSKYGNNLESWTNYLSGSGFSCTKDSSEISVFDRSCLSLQTSNLNISSGWNLLSVPLLAPDMSGSTLFPTAISPFFLFSTNYIPVTVLQNGNGYWAKFNGNQNVTIAGSRVNSDQITVNQGWNLIGPFNSEIPISGITTNPPNIIISPFYGYEGVYIIMDTLKVGKGYWVKTNSIGTIVLNSGLR